MSDPSRLDVELTDDAIVIRLPFETLTFAVTCCPLLWDGDLDEGPTVTDVQAFARAVLEELRYEEEDGSTPVHRMYDRVFERACEMGAERIRMPGEPSE